MRNLKRVLSLALALMMALSLMAFTGSASAAESATIPVASDLYPDYDQTNYPEAVDVITALRIVEGADGMLVPDGVLKRSEATTIAARLLLGVNAAATLPNVDTYTGYKDVDSVGHWAAPYIAFCDNQGIVSGVGGGNFDPDGQLTGVAFGKVILTVLGYDADKEGLKGDSWATNVTIALANAGISVKDSEGDPLDLSKPITREQAMEMTYQALQAALVEYPTNTINGAAMATRNGATYVTAALARDQRVNDQALTGGAGYTVEFAEKYFPELWLAGAETSWWRNATSSYYTDAFGRPAHTWTYKNQDIKTYLDEDLKVAEYTVGVTGAQMNAALHYSNISNYMVNVYLDGALLNEGDKTHDDILNSIQSKDTAYVASTGNGVKTELFVDHNPIYGNNQTGCITIVLINTYLAEVTSSSKVSVYYSSSTDKDDTDKNIAATGKTASVSGYAIGDKVRVTMAAKNHVAQANYADYTVQSVDTPDVVSDVTISAYTIQSENQTDDTIVNRLKTVTADGTKYEASNKAYYDANVLYNYNENRDELQYGTFAIYLDEYGFALGVEELEAADNYVFVVGWEKGESVLGNSGDRALIITMDGTMKVVNANAENVRAWDNSVGVQKWISKSSDLDRFKAVASNNLDAKDASVNLWYTYSMSGDTYVLEKEVRNQGMAVVGDVDDATADISGTKASLLKNNAYDEFTTSTSAYGNEKSVYIVVNADKSVNSDGSIIKIDRTITGIKNASISVAKQNVNGLSGFTDAFRGTPGAGNRFNTFFIYDKNNYVICAVTVGAVTTTSTDKVYFTDGIAERGKADDGTVYNQYEAIVNGVLTEVKVLDSVATNANPKAGEMFIAGFDANGYISKLADLGGNVNHELADTAAYDLNGTTNARDCYALRNGNDSGELILTLEGGTLWIEDHVKADKGYIVLNSGCKVFMKLATGNKYVEYDTIEAALNALKDAEANGRYVQQVAAICDSNSGYATTLIITQVKVGDRPGTTTGTSHPDNTNPYGLNLHGTDLYVTYDSDDVWDVADAIVSYLEEDSRGFTNVNVSISAGSISGVTANRGNTSVTFHLVDVVIADALKGFNSFVNQTISNTGAVTLSGTITPVKITTDTDESKTALQYFANEENNTLANFESLYDLEPGSWGFVTVNCNGGEMLLLIGKQCASPTHNWDGFSATISKEAATGELGIVYRDSSTGKVVFLSTWSDGTHTVTIGDLGLSGS